MDDVILHLRTPTTSSPYDFVEAKGCIFTQPTLLCCGGVRATHSQPQIANGYAKKALEMVHCLKTNGQCGFQTASLTYADGDADEDAITLESRARSFNNGYRDTTLYKNFIEEQLRPLFTDASGSRLDTQTAKKNFRNITALTHSYGSFFIEQVGNLLVQAMTEVGFTKEEIKEITRQVVVINTGCYTNFTAGDAAFTRLHIVHRHDAELSIDNRAYLEENLKKTAKAFVPKGKLACFFPDESSLVITTLNADRPPEEMERYDPTHPEKSLHALFDKKFHGCQTYMYYSFEEYGLILRTVIAAALANSLNNSIENYNSASEAPLPKKDSLLKYPNKLLFKPDDTTAFLRLGQGMNYNERIQQALGEVSEHRGRI